MTKGIENTLGLRSLQDALAAFGAAPEAQSAEPQTIETHDLPATLDFDLGDDEDVEQRLALAIDRERREEISEELLNGAGTERDLDNIKGELMRHAETLIELGMELDPGRAPRAFEVANALIKNAMDAVTTKREFQLKAMKILQDQRKLDLEERKLAGKSDGVETGPVITGHATVLSVDTTDMLREMQNHLKELNKEPPPQGNLDN